MYLAKRRDILKQKYIVIGVSISIALLLVLGFYLIFMPLFRQLGSMGAKIKKGEMIIPDAGGYRREYEKLEVQIDSLRQQIAQSKKKLFWKKDITLFLEKLTYIAQALAVDFISIKPSLDLEAIKSDDEDESILMFRNPINITMKTGYWELIDFLRRIEESDRFLRVDDITIEVDTKDISQRNVKMILSIFSAD